MTEPTKNLQTAEPKQQSRVLAGDTAQPQSEPPIISAEVSERSTLVLPQDFYAEFTARPDVRKILKRLAK